MKVLMGEDYWYLKNRLNKLNEQQDSGSPPPILYPQIVGTSEGATQTVREGEQLNEGG